MTDQEQDINREKIAGVAHNKWVAAGAIPCDPRTHEYWLEAEKELGLLEDDPEIKPSSGFKMPAYFGAPE